jgi:hypothetical protein
MARRYRLPSRREWEIFPTLQSVDVGSASAPARTPVRLHSSRQRWDAPVLGARATEAKRGVQQDGGDVGRACGQRIATPQGSLPTAMSAIFAFRSVSITETLADRPQAT